VPETVIFTQAISYEADMILARQRSRQISSFLGFDAHYQIRIATAVSEIVREILIESGRGQVEYIIEDKNAQYAFLIQVNAQNATAALAVQPNGTPAPIAKGILTAMQNVQRLMKYYHFNVSDSTSDVVIRFGEHIPSRDWKSLTSLATEVTQHLLKQTPQSPFEELHQQNQELLDALEEIKQTRDLLEIRVQERTRELEMLNTELEDRVAERTAQLETTNSELEAFSYSVSHDLRAPLRIIDGFSKILLSKHGNSFDTDSQELFEGIATNVKDMANLINGLLTLSRAARGEFKKEAVNLSQMCHRILSQMQLVDPDRLIEIDIQEDVIVKGDKTLLGVVLSNLLNNAWKFTASRDKAFIQFGVRQIDDKPTYFVRDNGVGFDMSQSQRLFAPFQRLQNAANFAGTGIGLATVKRVISRHQGHVWVESEPDVGTTFYFVLPHG
jgi:signal transduction histidine kinase